MKKYSIIVVSLLLLAACKDTAPVTPVIGYPEGSLELFESYPLDVTEPSGLSFGSNRSTLLTVSDNTNQVYELDFEGNILRTLDYVGKDLEGVTYNPDKDIIAVAEEADREITLIDYQSGEKIETYKIDIPIGADNSGLEGVSYNLNNKMYYIVNETNPDLMVVWNPLSRIISEENMDFAADYSGIFVDDGNSLLWIVSDQSERVYKCDYNAKVLLQFDLDRVKYEGIVVMNDTLFLVNDATARLNIYKIKTN